MNTRPESDNMSDLWGAPVAQASAEGARGAWFRDTRFAMFIHWGLYSEAAGHWQGRDYHGIAEWLMYSARLPAADYAQLATCFNPVDFDAQEWVRLAVDAGMKYLVVTAKHHDGFAMFKSSASAFNIVDATPFGRDPLAELAAACAAEGLKLGFYYSQYQDWHEPDAAGNTWDFTAPGDFDRYLREKARPQIEELLTNYGPVALIWFDTPGDLSRADSQDLLDTIRHFQPDCLVNSRLGNGLGDYVTLGDQEIPLTAPEGLWEAIDTHNDTWGFSALDHNWKSPRELLSRLVRVASLGGNYLLNVGPTGRGRLPEPSVQVLREIGAWLHRHGESLYGARPSPLLQQAWGGTTTAGGKLYLHLLQWPNNRELWVPGLGATVQRARFFGAEGDLALLREGEHLRLELPDRPPDDLVSVLELTPGAPAADLPVRAYVHPGLVNEFTAPFARVQGCQLGRRSWMEKFGDWHHLDVLEGWTAAAAAEWDFMVLAADRFHLSAEYECWAEADGSEFEVTIGDNRLTFPALYTGGGEGLRTRAREVCLGLVELPTGDATLCLRALEVQANNAFLLAKLILTPFV
jgi:alpha-L-fucosidase